jgi:heterodisulfide reductase subunit A-like polyferredoxin
MTGANTSDERESKEPVKAMHMNLGVEDLATMAEKTMKRILILGGSFAGLNAAYELKHMLKREDAEITVIAR